ncbi:hypothetical protein, partial [Sinorhizobium sp. BJ1]|uniref:hypothetical protein n=1 Tax=Sinorhizobium sp. BJ1 TaxID=2035455 RepID=UPI001AECA48F
GSFRRLRRNAYKTRANSVERSEGDRFFPISQPLRSKKRSPALKASLCRGADKQTIVESVRRAKARNMLPILKPPCQGEWS